MKQTIGKPNEKAFKKKRCIDDFEEKNQAKYNKDIYGENFNENIYENWPESKITQKKKELLSLKMKKLDILKKYKYIQEKNKYKDEEQ